MRARFYDTTTRLALFAADITEHGECTFAEYLVASGYKYIKHCDCWVNKQLGVECVVFKD
jgi:hypothetical protein